MGDCDVFCAKYAVFAVNLVSALIGILFMTIGLVIFFIFKYYVDFTVEGLWSIPIILLIIGFFVILIALFGLCGAQSQNTCMLFTFSNLLTILLILQIGVGIYGSINQDQAISVLDEVLNESLKVNNKTWEFVQNELKCCGVNGPADWANINHGSTDLSDSCCAQSEVNGKTCTKEIAYKLGCKSALNDFLKPYYPFVALGLIVIAVIQVLLIGWSCFLYGAFKKEKYYSSIDSLSNSEDTC